MSKQQMILEHIKRHGFITARDMVGAPFYLNCPHRAIMNLRRQKYAIIDEIITKTKQVIENGKVRNVTTRYKKYFMAV